MAMKEMSSKEEGPVVDQQVSRLTDDGDVDQGRLDVMQGNRPTEEQMYQIQLIANGLNIDSSQLEDFLSNATVSEGENGGINVTMPDREFDAEVAIFGQILLRTAAARGSVEHMNFLPDTYIRATLEYFRSLEEDNTENPIPINRQTRALISRIAEREGLFTEDSTSRLDSVLRAIMLFNGVDNVLNQGLDVNDPNVHRSDLAGLAAGLCTNNAAEASLILRSVSAGSQNRRGELILNQSAAREVLSGVRNFIDVQARTENEKSLLEDRLSSAGRTVSDYITSVGGNPQEVYRLIAEDFHTLFTAQDIYPENPHLESAFQNLISGIRETERYQNDPGFARNFDLAIQLYRAAYSAWHPADFNHPSDPILQALTAQTNGSGMDESTHRFVVNFTSPHQDQEVFRITARRRRR